MSLFERVRVEGHEQVVFFSDPATGLRSIVAIHSTALGPSLGGVRARPYPSEEAALDDVLRLSRAMTYKAAVAGLNQGGGKAVILADRSELNEAMIRRFGRFIHGLSGRYVASIDMNTSSREIDWMALETPYVAGRSVAAGGLGEPGPVTAWGAFHGMRAALQHRFGDPSPAGRTVSIQGLGSVGWDLARHLKAAGARLQVCDVDEGRVARAVSELGAEPLALTAFLSTPCDVLAPCAIGGVVGGADIDVLRCEIVAGAANNVLVDEVTDSARLRARKILFAPDYVVNAGGIIAMHAEQLGQTVAHAMDVASGIFDTTLAVLSRAERESVTPVVAARRIADDRISSSL
jgi:glutamate dehydrogenase/leucine dehydrogenase